MDLPLRFLRSLFCCASGMRLPSNEQRTPGQGNTNLLRQGIAAYRDPDGFRLYLVAVGFTVASLPYFTAGVSSTPGLAKLVGGCNPRPGCRVVRSTPGGLSPSLRDFRAPYRTNCLRRRGSLLLEAEEPLPPSRGVRRCPPKPIHNFAGERV